MTVAIVHSKVTRLVKPANPKVGN